MIGLEIEDFAAGARDVAQRQQHLGGRQVFAGAPIHPRALGMAGNKALRQRRFAGACLGGESDDPPPAFASVGEGIVQAPQLYIPFQ